METFKLASPLKYFSVTQKFGNVMPIYTSMGMLGHDALDLYAQDGTPVYASHDGRVTFAGYDSARGIGIKIRTEETYDYQGKEVFFQSLYWHLKTGSLMVTASQHVKKGDLIAFADNTGLSTGSHLHYALMPLLRSTDKVDFYPVNPDNGYRGFIDPTPYLPPKKTFPTEVKYGDNNLEVVKIQAFLIRNGYMPPQALLGPYGPQTAKAVLMFQKANIKLSWYEEYVLRGTKIGPKTLAALNSYEERI